MTRQVAVLLGVSLPLFASCGPDITTSRLDPELGPVAFSITVEQITVLDTDLVAHPDISGDRVVWTRGGELGFDILMRTLGTLTDVPIAITDDDEFDPSISGDLIVWTVCCSSGSLDILGYDLSTGETIPIATTAAREEDADVDGPYVVFERDDGGSTNTDIWLYDHDSGLSHQITSGSAEELSPAVSGNRIVWQVANDGQSDIHTCVWDPGTQQCPATVVAATAASEVQPAVFGDVIAWNVALANELWVKDLNSGDPPQLIAHEIREWFEPPSLSADLLVWHDYRNASSTTGTIDGADIFLYDLASGEEIEVYVDPARLDRFPAVSGNRIVWNSLDPTLGAKLFIAELRIEQIPAIDALRALIDELVAAGGITNVGTAESLNAFLDVAELHFANGRVDLSCASLDKFISAVQRLSAGTGRQLITADAAELLIQAAEETKASFGCVE